MSHHHTGYRLLPARRNCDFGSTQGHPLFKNARPRLVVPTMFWRGKQGKRKDNEAGPAPAKAAGNAEAAEGIPETKSSSAGEKKTKRQPSSSKSAAGSSSRGPDFASLDFGSLVGTGGTVLTGVCAVGDPTKVEACEWRVAKVPEKQNSPMFKILF